MSSINSPFRYAGGKFRARSLICSLIPPHTYYAEPFAGGASIFFAKRKAPTNVLNDKDAELMNCYIHIRDHVEDMIAYLEGEEATRERYDYYANECQPETGLERAVQWYYLNRTSYSGIMNPENRYWGYDDECSMRPENWPDHLRRCSDKLRDVELTNEDFETIITKAPDDAFLFVDPPYFSSGQARFYAHKFTEKEHHRLEHVLSENRDRVNFLLTYDNCPTIRQYYQWANHLEQEWNYTLARTDDQKTTGNRENVNYKRANGKGKRTTGKELFILNYPVSTAAATAIEVLAKGEQNVECQQSLAE